MKLTLLTAGRLERTWILLDGCEDSRPQIRPHLTRLLSVKDTTDWSRSRNIQEWCGWTKESLCLPNRLHASFNKLACTGVSREGWRGVSRAGMCFWFCSGSILFFHSDVTLKGTKLRFKWKTCITTKSLHARYHSVLLENAKNVQTQIHISEL